MGHEKNRFLRFFFWCSRINPSDRAKKGLYCDRPLEVLAVAPPNLHTATRLSAIKISLLVVADARNVTPKVVNIWRGGGRQLYPCNMIRVAHNKTEYKPPHGEGANSLRPLIEGDAPTNIMKPDREIRE